MNTGDLVYWGVIFFGVEFSEFFLANVYAETVDTGHGHSSSLDAALREPRQLLAIG
jgi:hypothetical protein